MTSRFGNFLGFMLALILTATASAQDRKLPKPARLEIEGKSRKYIVYMPASVESGERAPAVIVLHGIGSSAKDAAMDLGFLELAEQRGFIAVFPQASGKWKSGHLEKKEDLSDVYFLRELIESLPRNYPVDDRRIYLVGKSTGGMMAFRMASEMSEYIAAFGVYGASLGSFKPTGTYRVAPPVRPIPLLHIHGMRDRQIPFGSLNADDPKFSTMANAQESVDVWVDYTGCEKVADSQVLAQGKVNKAAFRKGDDKSFVVLLSLVYQNETWPGSRRDRKKRKDNPPVLDGAKTMLDFFGKHGMDKAPRTTP